MMTHTELMVDLRRIKMDTKARNDGMDPYRSPYPIPNNMVASISCPIPSPSLLPTLNPMYHLKPPVSSSFSMSSTKPSRSSPSLFFVTAGAAPLLLTFCLWSF